MVLKKQKRRRLRRPDRQGSEVPRRLHERWAMDFVHDSLFDGRRFRALALTDIYSRQSLGIEVDLSLPSQRVVRFLERLTEVHGRPDKITVDNGPEFISKTMMKWAEKNSVDLDFIEPGNSVYICGVK